MTHTLEVVAHIENMAKLLLGDDKPLPLIMVVRKTNPLKKFGLPWHIYTLPKTNIVLKMVVSKRNLLFPGVYFQGLC